VVEPYTGSPLGPVARCTEFSGNGFDNWNIPGMSLVSASTVIIIFLYLLTVSNKNAVAGVVQDIKPLVKAALFKMIFVGVTGRTRTSNGTEIPLEFSTEIGQLFYAFVVLTNDYGAFLEINEIGDPVD